jgi:mRNA interferase RelE/StbE
MSDYFITVATSAQKEMDSFGDRLLERIERAVRALAATPRPSGVKKLKGERDYWRIRVGDYRVIYIVNDKARIVDIVRVAHRREVYD